MATPIQGEAQYIDALSRLTLRPLAATEVFPRLARLTNQQKKDFTDLADSNHVTIRAFEVINRVAGNCGHPEIQAWAMDVLMQERSRIDQALTYLQQVCDELEASGCPSLVMKSLDHWPDLGNDLDLLSTGDRRAILHVFRDKFRAHVEPQSWGDRLANKWNFVIPGLRESIEVHIGRLGQTGEHIDLARRFIGRRTLMQVCEHNFFVPAPEERVYAATLQRMYRHFYFRVCDIVNTATLLESGKLNFAELQAGALQAGIWPGVASFLNIVSEYVQQYRQTGLQLPYEVRSNAFVGAGRIYTRARFLRIPIIPCAAKLYIRQLRETAFSGNVPAALRLSLLPPLASAAAVAFRITGSDKGVW
ncbi:MAG TPA: hypothetical protein VKT33_09485 [Candidatus Angelobacter sp.]|nr:hypothetical protein [Candidatus Angelobacter sp.]